jgi:hypothetical protein
MGQFEFRRLFRVLANHRAGARNMGRRSNQTDDVARTY